jgi:hypothetical protein
MRSEAQRAERTPNPDSMDLYFQGMSWINKRAKSRRSPSWSCSQSWVHHPALPSGRAERQFSFSEGLRAAD